MLEPEFCQHLVEKLERIILSKVERGVVWFEVVMEESGQFFEEMTSSGCLPSINIDAATAEKSPLLDVMEGSSSQR